MLQHQSTFDSTSSRINIFNAFPDSKVSGDTEDFEDDGIEPDEYEPINSKKNADLHQWLSTSYYGAVSEKAHVTAVPIEYPKIEDSICGQGVENIDKNENTIDNRSNSLFFSISQNDKASTTEADNDFAVCRSCKSRYTRHRTTRYARIAWIVISCFLLSISLFPWGLLSVVFFVFIPYQVRRPMCKKCRNSVLSF